MAQKFYEWLFDMLNSDEDFPEDIDIDEIDTAEKLLCLDEVGLDSDELATYASMYAEKCIAAGDNPDFSGYEDYAQ